MNHKTSRLVFLAQALIVLTLALTMAAISGARAQASKLSAIESPSSVTTDIYNDQTIVVQSAPVGATVYDRATIHVSNPPPFPGGTVTFDLFHNTTCSGVPVSSETNPVANYAAFSSPTVVPITGLSYLAHYSGDGTFGGSDGVCEPLNAIVTIKSDAGCDGWVLESGENTNVGGVMNSAAATLRMGDDAARKQYRSILCFYTGPRLPDTAVVTKVTLKVKKQGASGAGDPVSLFQGFMVDIKKGVFGTSALQLSDWQATANKTLGPFTPTPSGGWYTFNLTPDKAYINKLATNSGLTQIRLRFNLDDNNDAVANFLGLYSGDAGAASRPQLIIEYSVP